MHLLLGAYYCINRTNLNAQGTTNTLGLPDLCNTSWFRPIKGFIQWSDLAAKQITQVTNGPLSPWRTSVDGFAGSDGRCIGPAAREAT